MRGTEREDAEREREDEESSSRGLAEAVRPRWVFTAKTQRGRTISEKVTFRKQGQLFRVFANSGGEDWQWTLVEERTGSEQFSSSPYEETYNKSIHWLIMMIQLNSSSWGAVRILSVGGDVHETRYVEVGRGLQRSSSSFTRKPKKLLLREVVLGTTVVLGTVLGTTEKVLL